MGEEKDVGKEDRGTKEAGELKPQRVTWVGRMSHQMIGAILSKGDVVRVGLRFLYDAGADV